MNAMKHNLHCTCQNCSGTGMTLTEQTRMCDGTGTRKIAAPDRELDRNAVRSREQAKMVARVTFAQPL